MTRDQLKQLEDQLWTAADSLRANSDLKASEYSIPVLGKDEWRKEFAVYTNTITSLYEACKPEILGKPVVRKVTVFHYLRDMIDAVIQQQDLDEVNRKIGELLDASVVVDRTLGSKLTEEPTGEGNRFGKIRRGKVWDLSKIDFEKLEAEFKKATYKNIEIADLRAFLEKKLAELLDQNATRKDFAQRLQEVIDRYNSEGASNTAYFEELMKFAKEMRAEEERHHREGLSEEELEIYDLLKKDAMTRAEEQKVKLAACKLLERLKAGQPKLLVQDWYKDTQSKEQVLTVVKDVLNEELPKTYDRVTFSEKCNQFFEVMLDYARTGKKWAA